MAHSRKPFFSRKTIQIKHAPNTNHYAPNTSIRQRSRVGDWLRLGCWSSFLSSTFPNQISRPHAGPPQDPQAESAIRKSVILTCRNIVAVKAVVTPNFVEVFHEVTNWLSPIDGTSRPSARMNSKAPMCTANFLQGTWSSLYTLFPDLRTDGLECFIEVVKCRRKREKSNITSEIDELKRHRLIGLIPFLRPTIPFTKLSEQAMSPILHQRPSRQVFQVR